MATRIEFGQLCDMVSANAQRRIRVCGRCWHGPISLGDVFRTATDNLASQPIALSVVRIELYGHDMDELGQGLTGCLTLEGDGHNRLSDGGRIGA